MHEHSFWLCIWTLVSSVAISLMFTVFSCSKLETDAQLELARQGRTSAEIFCILEGSLVGAPATALFCSNIIDDIEGVEDDSNS